MDQSDVFGWVEGGEGGGREARGRRKEKGGQGRKPGKGASARGLEQDTAIRLPRGHNGVVHADRSAESNAAKNPSSRVTRNVKTVH